MVKLHKSLMVKLHKPQAALPQASAFMPQEDPDEMQVPYYYTSY